MNNYMDYLIKLELIVVGIILAMFVIVSTVYLCTIKKNISKYLERVMDFLRYILGHA